MPIVLLRVDERLIHGQVVVGWGEHLHMDHIVVIDDEISDSAWEQELYCLGVPAGVDALFTSVAHAREVLSQWERDGRRVVLLLRDCDSLDRLAAGGLLDGMEVNLGGLHAAKGRDPVLPYLFLSEEDRDRLRRVARSGAKISARDLPNSRALPLWEMITDA